MPLHRFPVVQLLIGFLPGISAAHALYSPHPGILIPIAILLLGILLILKSKGYGVSSRSYSIVVICTAAILGMLSITTKQAPYQKDHFTHFLHKGQNLQLRVVRLQNSGTFYQSAICEVQQLNDIPTRGKLLLQYPKNENHEFAPDQLLFLKGNPEQIRTALNPGQFDFAKYMRQQGIRYRLRLQADHPFSLEMGASTLQGKAHQFRKYLQQRLEKTGFNGDAKALFLALILGDRSEISDVVKEDFSRSGIVHLLAISGLHIGILLLGLKWLTQGLTRFPGGRRIQLILVLGALWTYAFISGLSPSVIRATCMFSFIGYALLMNRKGMMVNSVAWSILLILLLGNPYLLFQAGFQMSYLALLGILIFFPKFNALWKFRFRPLQKLLELSWVSLSAQLGVLPLSLYYFHQFPGVFLLANLSILPFLGLILGLGFLVLILSVLEYLPDLLLQLYQALLNLWLNWAKILGDLELFHFRDIPFQSWQLLLGYGLLGCAGYYLYYRRQKVLWVFLSFVFSWIVLTHHNEFNSSAKEELIVLNRYKASALAYRRGGLLEVYTRDTTGIATVIKDLKKFRRIEEVRYKPMGYSYHFAGQTLIRITRKEELQEVPESVSILWLSNAPKIHLERVLTRYKPKQVIADGSNYPSLVTVWKNTCENLGIPFHATAESGAFLLNH